ALQYAARRIEHPHLTGERGDADRNRQPAGRWRAGAVVRISAINPYGSGDSIAHEIDHDVREKLIFGERALDVVARIAPYFELLDDPRRSSHGVVVEHERDGARFVLLLVEVIELLGAVRRRGTLPGSLFIRHFVFRRRDSAAHVEMNSGEAVGELARQRSRDRASPIAALRAKPRVRQRLRHELVPEAGDGGRTDGDLRFRRKAKARDGRHDDVERIVSRAAEARGIGQGTDRFDEFEHGPGPTVGEHERQRFRTAPFDMIEVESNVVVQYSVNARMNAQLAP